MAYGRLETNFSYGMQCPDCKAFNIVIDSRHEGRCYECGKSFDPVELFGKDLIEHYLEIDFGRG